jgi:hypothetical protein
MRRYDDPVDVRTGQVAGPGAGTTRSLLDEGPEQFLWRGRLWKVSAVVARWSETGAWWQSRGAQAVLGDDDPAGPVAAGDLTTDLAGGREVWRVEAGRGLATAGRGVFDLVFDWADGSWRLVRCLD